MNKKILAVIALCLAMVLALAACAQAPNEAEPTPVGRSRPNGANRPKRGG